MRGISNDLADRIVEAHVARYPDATPAEVLLKLGEELGELMRAENTGRGSVAEEVADVLGVLLVYVGRFYPELVVEEITAAKHRVVVERWNAGRRDPNEATVEISIVVETEAYEATMARLDDLGLLWPTFEEVEEKSSTVRPEEVL